MGGGGAKSVGPEAGTIARFTLFHFLACLDCHIAGLDSTGSHGRRNMVLVTDPNKIFIIFHASPVCFLSLIKKYILRSVRYQGNWSNFCRITHAAAMLTSVYGNL